MSDILKNVDGQMKKDLDNCLTQLADVLRKVGVLEMTIDEHYQHHTLDAEPHATAQAIHTFCEHVSKMYSEIVGEG